MEAQIGDGNYKNILRYLVLSQNVFIITTFLNFIDQQQLRAIVQVALAGQKSQKFYRIAVAKLFVSSYLNRVDRTIFFLFYEETEFQNIEKQTINAMASNNYPFLENAFHSFQHILHALSEQVEFLEQKREFLEVIETIFFEPDMPMPQMKRQTIGMYCQTPFQHFLSLKRFEEEGLGMGEWLEDCLSELKQKLEHEVATGVSQNTNNLQKLMETVRYQGWLVDSSSWKDYLVQGFHTHNIIVLLTALSSELVDTYSVFLSNIKDPFLRFVEFNLRSSIYRNIMLAIEDRLGFVMEDYNLLYGNNYHPPPLLPKYSFWRTGLSIWVQKMAGYHEANRRIYEYITAKLRENSLLRHLSNKIERLPSVYSELRDEAELSGFSEVLKDQAYNETEGALELESFFDNNQEIYQVLAKDYLEYSVDMSINQTSVHWCGHSQHLIACSPTYHTIAASLLESSKAFYLNLRAKIERTIPADLRVLTFRELVKEDLRFIGEFFAKPVTVRELISIANQHIKQFASPVGGKVISGEELIVKHLIPMQFEEKDQLLSYFASKAEIAPDCEQSLTFFYNTQADRGAEMPKVLFEVESDHSEEEHEIYESDNQSL